MRELRCLHRLVKDRCSLWLSSVTLTKKGWSNRSAVSFSQIVSLSSTHLQHANSSLTASPPSKGTALLVGNTESALGGCHGFELQKIPSVKRSCSVLTVLQQKHGTSWRVSGRAARGWKELDRTCGRKGSWSPVWNLEQEGRGRKSLCDGLRAVLARGVLFLCDWTQRFPEVCLLSENGV